MRFEREKTFAHERGARFVGSVSFPLRDVSMWPVLLLRREEAPGGKAPSELSSCREEFGFRGGELRARASPHIRHSTSASEHEARSEYIWGGKPAFVDERDFIVVGLVFKN